MNRKCVTFYTVTCVGLPIPRRIYYVMQCDFISTSHTSMVSVCAMTVYNAVCFYCLLFCCT